MYTVQTIEVVPPLIELGEGCYKSVYAYQGKEFADLDAPVKEMWMTIADSVLKELGIEPGEDLNSPQMQALKRPIPKKSVSKPSGPRKKRRAVSDEEMFKVVQMYESGMSQTEIGRQQGRTSGTIHQILKKYERKTGQQTQKGAKDESKNDRYARV